MNYNKITRRTEQKTKTKIKTDDKLIGLPNAGKRYPKVTDDKLTLNENERVIRIYTIRNLPMKQKRGGAHAECDKPWH